LFLLLAFWAAARLFGFWPAAVGFLLLAADPFHIAHSRLLHLDGLSSSLMLLSLLSLMNYLYRGYRRLDLAASGAAAGLAWLTKSPALFLIPLAGLLLLLELAARRRKAGRLERKVLRWAAQSLVLWGLPGLAIFVLLWPAMWVDPLFTVRRVLGAAGGAAVHGHEEVLYFNGAIVDGDPGIHFYPISYLWRATPVVLVGLGLLALAALKARLVPPEQRRPLAALLLFAVLFTIFMSLGAKKFDRYLLPVYAPLDLMAGVGWVAAARWLQERWSPRLAGAAAVTLVLLAVTGQAGSAAAAFPYYLSYYNPIMGGTRAAPEVMMVGWGEGLDQAAAYLNARPGQELPQVMTGVWTGTFSYFYKGPVEESHFSPGEETIQAWIDSDYCVVYINEWQRGQLPQALLKYLDNLRPELVVRLQGLDYVYVYDISDLSPPDYMFADPQPGVKGTAGKLPETAG
jgi:hypothetical protein